MSQPVDAGTHLGEVGLFQDQVVLPRFTLLCSARAGSASCSGLADVAADARHNGTMPLRLRSCGRLIGARGLLPSRAAFGIGCRYGFWQTALPSGWACSPLRDRRFRRLAHGRSWLAASSAIAAGCQPPRLLPRLPAPSGDHPSLVRPVAMSLAARSVRRPGLARDATQASARVMPWAHMWRGRLLPWASWAAWMASWARL